VRGCAANSVLSVNKVLYFLLSNAIFEFSENIVNYFSNGKLKSIQMRWVSHFYAFKKKLVSLFKHQKKKKEVNTSPQWELKSFPTKTFTVVLLRTRKQ